MPFFFGIYLLQGSFLLLLIADKLQVEASASVVRACETIVRAHEACVVTLSTEYQVCYGMNDRLGSLSRTGTTKVLTWWGMRTAQLQQSNAKRSGPSSGQGA